MAGDRSIVVAEIEYLKPDPLYDEQQPYSIASRPPLGIKRTNIMQVPVKTSIHNSRGKKAQFSLNVNGFEWVDHPLNFDVNQDAQVNDYMNEMGTFLRQHLNAEKVIVYDYVIRHQREKNQPRPEGVSRKVKKQILGAHIDISRESAISRIKLKCEDQAEELLEKHWQIVNIWRPLNGPVKSMPLAVCDSRYLHEDDIVASDIVLPHLQIQAYEIWYNPNQAWYFLDQQESTEVLLMLSADSITSIRCAHSAFEDPKTKTDDPKRQSIELRCMVFY
ncbi:uncharacterized protein FSUBG_8082 [Fusarium subglutinans]|uniref:Methyltransferase n=1 Tax=Gibberella subglutinans TaxID=42677 RepID=A0A8H5PT25_GIBSU|nr:uncharacterized protein FSUBG_8082 [Fusarium subglutinans]KAF5601716.1 hypothetical protein FSUBG_8082 [Fusarium subglutinans]